MLKTRAKLWIAAVVLLLVGIAVVLLLPRVRLLMSLKSDYSRDKAPWAYQIPMERTIEGSAEAVRTERLSCAWFSFNAPWQGGQTFESEHAKAFVFNGQKAFVVALRPKEEGIVKALLGSDPDEAREMKQLLGEDNLRSEFAALDFCLRVTPEQAGPMSSVRDLTRIATMLILKSAFTPLGNEIYTVRLAALQGFQFGNPAAATEIYVYLFDPADRLYRTKFHAVTQSEIDAILASIEFTPVD
jgi:hypothetical protein